MVEIMLLQKSVDPVSEHSVPFEVFSQMPLHSTLVFCSFIFLISLSARIFCFCRLYIFQFFSSFVACQPGSGVILAIFLYLSSLATHNQEQSFLRP